MGRKKIEIVPIFYVFSAFFQRSISIMGYVVVFHVFLFKGKAEGIQAPYLNKALHPHTEIKEGVFRKRQNNSSQLALVAHHGHTEQEKGELISGPEGRC